LTGVAAALGAAQIGVEAALQVVRIATPKTEAAWVERARRRTIKHLREEVAAALTVVRLVGEGDCLPAGARRVGGLSDPRADSGERPVWSTEIGRRRRERDSGTGQQQPAPSIRDSLRRAAAVGCNAR
jgi:hypothetical protein